MTSEHPFSRRFGCRITDAIHYRGLRVILLENEFIRVAVLPEKGAEIHSLQYKPADLDPLLRLRGGLRAPTPYLPTIDNPDGAFNDFYSGGWQEMLPNAGGPSIVGGAPIGRHGEAALLPWQWEIIQDDPDRVAVRLSVRTIRTPFYLERTMSLQSGQSALRLDETLVNEGSDQLAFMWGHHPAFGEPFLDGSCILDVPAEEVEVHEFPLDPANRLQPGIRGSWPIVTGVNGGEIDLRAIPPRTIRSADMLYLTGLHAGWYALTNRRLGYGLALEWDAEVFPVLWVWQEFCGSHGYPWYGNTYALGLEPCTSYATTGGSGLAEAMRAGREQRLAPGARLTSWVNARFYQAPESGHVTDIASVRDASALSSGEVPAMREEAIR